MRRGGTTLLELLVVTVLFSLILTVVLGFYVWGHNTTESQSRIADNDRRLMQMVDRVHLLLGSSEIERVIPNEMDFTPIDNSALDRRVMNFSANAQSIVVLNGGTGGGQVVLRTQGHSEVLLQLLSYETITFNYSGGWGGGYIDITDSGTPPVTRTGQGQLHPYSITRRLLVEPPL
ncbi:MAG: hypothetical protein ACYCW6_15120 [Candidatus Xenobia bacterium]